MLYLRHSTDSKLTLGSREVEVYDKARVRTNHTEVDIVQGQFCLDLGLPTKRHQVVVFSAKNEYFMAFCINFTSWKLPVQCDVMYEDMNTLALGGFNFTIGTFI